MPAVLRALRVGIPDEVWVPDELDTPEQPESVTAAATIPTSDTLVRDSHMRREPS